MLLHFVCACLIPGTHLSNVTREGAYMVNIILAGGHVDVGRQIERRIKRVFTTTWEVYGSL